MENVGALSSTNVECRRVFNYILKDCPANSFIAKKSSLKRQFPLGPLGLFFLSQEAHKRGMALYWTTNKLANVGLQA